MGIGESPGGGCTAPLSFGQEQLWYQEQLRPDAVEYVLHKVFAVSGPLDADALQTALDTLVARHEVLRTRYRTRDDRPVQVIDSVGAARLSIVDLRSVPAGERDRRTLEVITTEARRPFDLAREHPFRTVLIRRSAADHVLLPVVHHIAFDGWSWGVLERELSRCYGEATGGAPAALDPLPVQYADFACWQREAATASGQLWDRQLGHWRRRLAGVPALELPTDRPRPGRWDPTGDSLEFVLPAELAGQVRRLARERRATPFAVFLAAFHVLLGRHAGQADVAVGVSTTGRGRPELERLVGTFVNTVVLRADLSAAGSFADLAEQVRDRTLDALSHKDVPFTEVVARLAPDRDLSRNPLFQAAFGLHELPRQGTLELAGLTVTPQPSVPAGAPFDLALYLGWRPDGAVGGQLLYPTALFDRDRIERLAGHYVELLRGAVRTPGLPLRRLGMLTRPERRWLLAAGAGPAVEPPAGCLPELFFGQARRTPDAAAVVAGGAAVGYAELADRVHGLAAHLRGLGVGAETRVAVALDRQVDLVAAVLAVLAAGGVYVPLDPDLPAARLEAVLADAAAAVVLTSAAPPRRWSAGAAAVVLVEDVPAATSGAAGGAAAGLPPVDPDAAAYVIYTSGSTGRPKGVVVSHAGIGNRVRWAVDHLRLAPADRVLQRTTVGFDASVWELLAPLVCGGAVVLAPPGGQADPQVIARAVAEHGVTVLQLVPSVLGLLLQEPDLARCTSLRVVCSAGEPLPAAHAERLRAVLDVEMINTYGPTECSIDVTAWHHRSGDGLDIVPPDIVPLDIVPIGTPLPNTRLLVLDGRDDLVPVETPGELCVSGVGLARGYLGQPALTADRFVPNPFGVEPGERVYRTGDVVAWRPDGALRFCGRVDRQVKIRGVRVEPAAVEAALDADPQVARAAVVTRRTPDGELELVGYLLPAAGQRLDVERVRARLAGTLPPALVPAVLQPVRSVPLTRSGKADLAALPGQAVDAPAPARPRVEPRTPTERAVASIWSELLGTGAVAADDDFFALGGHSLTAIRVLLRLRRAFGVQLTVAELLTVRTVAGLAELVDRGGRGGRGAEPAAIEPVPRDRPLPLSYEQRRLWFLDQLEPGSVEYLIPLAFRLHGPVDADALRAALSGLAARHEVLRTRYVTVDGDPRQVADPPGPVAFTVADVSAADDPELAAGRLVRAHQGPFDLRREPPLRACLVRTAGGEHVLAVTLHHITFDAWSMGVFWRELAARYQAAVDGRVAPLPALPVQYADFACWQADRQSSPELAGQLRYWRERLAGLRPQELPTDRARPALRDPSGAEVLVEVPAELGEAVAALAARHGATLFMVLLAAFDVLLARYTNQSDVLVGTPVSGRGRPETEDLIGFFVNNLVLRADLAGSPSFVDFLGQVRQSVLAAFGNQDVPFERLVDELRPDRDLSRNPLFQVMFEVQHHDRMAAALGAAAVEGIWFTSAVAKFDLTLSVEQLPDQPLRCRFEYATALFDRPTIDRMAANYLRLLRSVAADPGVPVDALDIVADDQLAAVLHGWNAAGPADAGLVPVTELFERQAAATPDAVAVVFGGTRLTYAELDARADRVASRLRALGVAPEQAVGVFLERGPDVVVALLGVLKAGGVYVPFDPDHPAQRLAFMLADCAARVVLTHRRLAGRLAGLPVQPLPLDAEQGAAAAAGADRTPGRAPRVRGDGLAYVIYTSGSTGRPKGVMVDHRAYAHHCREVAGAYGIGPDDRVVLLSAVTFDASMEQIMATLLRGATLVVSEPLFWDPAELPDRVAEQRITIMELTPAYYREVIRQVRPGDERLRHLRLMNVGSDVVTVDDARRWHATGLPGRFLCNYGPTEATVVCVVHPVPRADGTGRGDPADAGRPLPIGRPLPGTRAYVLDRQLRPVPVGVPGELCLGGVRLARGYLNRPALTADRFVPDPFDPAGGGRLYRTGDLAWFQPDGTIAFGGRLDEQVKIRGFRIELGEIEAALSRHPAVRAAVVIARGVPDLRLVGYVVPAAGTAVDPAALREHLAERLPEYMIPSLWVALSELPLTPSRKVDRAALPSPESGRAALGGGYLPPRTPTERAVAEIWADVLGTDPVGVHDDFFLLGGHSLLATRLLARLRQAFGVQLPLRRLFEATTVATLSAAVQAEVAAEIDGLSDAEVAELLSQEGVS